MSKVKLSVSVIICAYTFDRWTDLQKAIGSLQHQTVDTPEIVLVVDHNHDLYVAACKYFLGVKVLENQELRGLAGARNTGVDAANGKIVAFLDDDAVAEPDWLEHLLQPYEEKDVIGVGGSILPDWPGQRPDWFPDEFNWVVGCTYLGMSEKPSPVRNLIGANMSYRREIFEGCYFYSGLGYTNGRMLGGEETDFCIRVTSQRPSARLMYQPTARVRHSVSENRIYWRYFRERCYNEGLTKAVLARRVGSTAGLASERTYTFVTLPRGILRGLADSIFRAETAGVFRSAAIMSGLAVTVAGYLIGSAAQRVPALQEFAGLASQPGPRISA